jgi:hypothetical protein
MQRRIVIASAIAAAISGRPQELEAQWLNWIIGIAIACIAVDLVDRYWFHDDAKRYVNDKMEDADQTYFARQEQERKREEAINAIMQKLGYNYALSQQIVDYMGVNRVPAVIGGKLGVWCQTDTTGRNFNKIFARLQNRSADQMSGQVKYMISDLRTGKGEMQIDSHGYRLNGHGVLEMETPVLASLPSPGWKRVTVIDRPKWVSASTADVLVVPYQAVAK